MKKVIFIGERELGAHALKRLFAMGSCRITTVVTTKLPRPSAWWPGPLVEDLARERNLRVLDASGLSADELMTDDRPDIVISILNNQFRTEKFLSWPTLYAVNLHGAPLPSFQGNNCTLFAILDNAQEFGVTLYRPTTEADEGPIIARRMFKIPAGITNQDLYNLTVRCGKELIDASLEGVVSGDIRELEEFDRGKARFFNALPSREILPSQMSPAEIDRIVRAFWFPPFEPAYMSLPHKKVWLFPESVKSMLCHRCEKRS